MDTAHRDCQHPDLCGCSCTTCGRAWEEAGAPRCAGSRSSHDEVHRRQVVDTRAQLKHRIWLRIAFLQAELATCLRLQVGCVLLNARGHVLGTGYNGSLPGRPHCTPATCNSSARCLRTQHAERNALDHSSAGDVQAAYVTDEPCLSCTKDLLARGCLAIYYHRPYAMGDEERRWRDLHVSEGGCRVVRLEVSGAVAS